MKHIIATIFLTVLVACASAPSPNYSIATANDTVAAYTTVVRQALERGRITPEQAGKASDKAKKAREAIHTAQLALLKCAPPSCDPTSILQGLQPTLFELERELRAQGVKP
jgi:hypothetical protein